jgi:glycerol uptake facilitator-like aquaporin
VNLARRATAEAVGTALLLAGVVGSGIMAQRLAGGNIGIALLANTLATGGVLVAIILTFGPISGAHFNPVVTLCDAWQRGIAWRDVPAYLFAQISGGVIGVAAANMMFGLPPLFSSQHVRTGGSQWLGEFIATFGLMAVIWGCSRSRSEVTPFVVAAYIVGAYWFTSSTSFANPAVTIARSLSDTFAGIRPVDVLPFVAFQLAGAAAATALFSWFAPSTNRTAEFVATPLETSPANGSPSQADIAPSARSKNTACSVEIGSTSPSRRNS